MFTTDAAARILDCAPDQLPAPPAGDADWSVDELVRAAVAVSLCWCIDRQNLAEINGMLRLTQSLEDFPDVASEPILIASTHGFVLAARADIAEIIDRSDGKVSHIIDMEALSLRIQLAASLEAQRGTTAE